MKYLMLLLFLLIALPLHAQTLNAPGVPGTGGNAIFDNLSAGPGNISITGNTSNSVMNNVSVNGVINVKAYGAKGDGVTDDYSAIMAAKNASGPGAKQCIYFPAGTYMIKPTADTTTGVLSHDGLNFSNNSDPNTWAFCAYGDNMFTSQ